MAIASTGGNLHWNYFIALERDLEMLSRYVEFTEQNFNTYSIELAHLLFAAASEVDVVAKLLCQQLAPHAPRGNINDYKKVLVPALPDIPTTEVTVPRYGLTFAPWSNWSNEEHPSWWRSYNNVKHERATYFDEATLKNTLNALGGLLVVTHAYYNRILPVGELGRADLRETSRQLQPEPALLRLKGDFYYHQLIG